VVARGAWWPTGIARGYREVAGLLESAESESEASWGRGFRGVIRARSAGVSYVVSDRSSGHGLTSHRAAFSGGSVWPALPGAFCAQRAQPVQPPAASAGAAADEGGDRVGNASAAQADWSTAITELEKKAPKGGSAAGESGEEILGRFMLCRKGASEADEHGSNMLERQNHELSGGNEGWRVFPHEQRACGLIAARWMETNQEWR